MDGGPYEVSPMARRAKSTKVKAPIEETPVEAPVVESAQEESPAPAPVPVEVVDYAPPKLSSEELRSILGAEMQIVTLRLNPEG